MYRVRTPDQNDWWVVLKFITTNFLNLKSNKKTLSEKMYDISQALDFSHTNAPIWQGSFQGNKRNYNHGFWSVFNGQRLLYVRDYKNVPGRR